MQTAVENIKQGLGIKPSNLVANVNVSKMHQIRDSLTSDPSMAKIKYHINCVAQNDLKVMAEMDRFELGNETFKHSSTFKEYFDLPKQILGGDSAPNPTEHLLSALGGCLTMSLLKVAACENIALSGVLCKVKGKVDLRSSFSDEFQDISPGIKAVCAKFQIQSVENLPITQLHQLIQKAERNSIVTQTLKRGTKVCVCLKGEEREFELKHGLISEEKLREEERTSKTVYEGQRAEPGFMEKAKETVEQGAQQVGAALGIGKPSPSQTYAAGASTSPSQTRIGPGSTAASYASKPELDRPLQQRGPEYQAHPQPSHVPIGSEMKEAGALKEKHPGVESGVGPAGRISDVAGLDIAAKGKSETTR